jgi:hypothetical protein
MKYTIALFLLFTGNMLYAQFTDTTHYHLVLAATGSVNRTNDGNAYLLNNSLNFGIKKKSITLTAANSWVYGSQNSTLTNNDFSSTLFFDLYKTFPHFFYWGLLNYNTSYSLKINNQLLAGAGAAYSIIDKKNVYFNLSDGVLFDQSSLPGNSDYHTWRNSFRLQFHFSANDDLLTFDTSNFLQSAFANSNDYIIRTTTTLGLKLHKWISLTTTLNYNKMHITNSENLVLTYGLTLDKYF